MDETIPKRRRGRPRKQAAEAGPYREPTPPQEPREVCPRGYAIVRRREGDTTGWSLVEVHDVPLDVLMPHAVEVGPVRDLATTIAVVEKALQKIAYSGV